MNIDYSKYLRNNSINENKKYVKNVFLSKYLRHIYINENKDESNDSTDNKNTSIIKDPKGKIIAGLEGMKSGAVMQAVSKSLGTNSLKFLGKHLIDILINAAKNGKVKFDAIKGAAKDFNVKNVEDNSKIDWEHVEIDPSGISMKCFFDGDSKKIIDTFMKEYENDMKDVKKEIDETDKKLHDDVKKAGVKIDDEKLDQNGLVVASVIDNDKNKDKSGKELTKEVDQKITQNEEAKELVKQAKESEKKLDQIKVDPKIEKMSDEELAKAVEEADKKEKSGGKSGSKSTDTIVKEVDEKLTAKLGKDYKQSLLTGIYNKEELSKNAKKNKLGKVDFSSIKSDKVVGVRIDFFGDEAADVVSEVVDDKAGFVVRKVDSSEKDEGVKKVYETFSKVLKDAVGDDAEGDAVAFLKHWQGKNDDGNFDSLFMFVGLKDDKTNESMNESMLNEDENAISLDNIAAAIAIKTAELVKNNSEVDSSDGLEAITKWVVDAAKEMDYDGDMTSELQDRAEMIYKAAQSGKDLASVAKEFTTDTAMKVAEKMTSIDPTDGGLDLENYSFKGVKKLAGIVAKGAQGEIENLMSKVSIDGNKIRGFNTNAVLNQAAKSMGMKQSEIMDMFSRGGVMSTRGAQIRLDTSLRGFLVDYEKDPTKAVSNLMKLGKNAAQKDALAEIVCKMKPEAVEHFEKAGIDINGTIDKLGSAKDTAKTAAKAAADGMTSDDVANAIKNNAIGKSGAIFSYSTMSQQLSQLDDIYDDGKVTPEEFEKLKKFGSQLDEFNEWAKQNADSDNPAVQQKIVLIKRLQGKYNDMILTNHPGDVTINAGETNEKTLERLGTSSQNEAKVAETAANDEDAQKASGGWKKALGLDKAFTAIGIARLAAKSTGIVLNHGKAVIDMAGAQAMKYKEDKNIIADFRITLTNGEGSKSKFEDTKFAVRFDVNDCKWHATCLDDRKMKFPEDKLIKVALDSEEGKKFRQYCLNRWKSIFAPEDERRAIIPFILKNAEKLGIGDGKLPKEFVQNIKKMSEKFDKIEAALK